MKRDDAIKVILDIGHERGDAVIPDYSGRGMYGAICYGIVTDSAADVIEDAAEGGLRGAKTDGMGRHTIVYWPSVEGDED